MQYEPDPNTQFPRYEGHRSPMNDAVALEPLRAPGMRLMVRGCLITAVVALLGLGMAIYIYARTWGLFATLGEYRQFDVKKNVYALRFASPNSFVSSSTTYMGEFSLWTIDPPKQTILPGAGRCMDVSRDGRWLVTGNYEGDITLLELPTGRIARQWRLPEGSVLGVAINGDGREVFIAQGPTKLESSWSIGEPLAKYSFWAAKSDDEELDDPIASLDVPLRAIDVSDDGNVVALRTSDYSLWVWSRDIAQFSTVPNDPEPHGGTELSWGINGGVKVTSDGSIALCGPIIVNTGTSERRNLVDVPWPPNRGALESADLSDNGKRAVLGFDNGVVIVIDVPSMSEVWSGRVSKSGAAVWAVALSPDGNWLLTGCGYGRGLMMPLDPKRGITHRSDTYIRLWKLPELLK